jgi:tetratricopeptide (TPR) repeat protein
MGITLCMIVKDEAERLPACLKSVQPLTQDIVVLDTGSTDQSVAIAERYGAKVIPYTWENDFAAARNASLAAAWGDWILVLDADEILDPSCIATLHALDRGDPFQSIAADRILLVNFLRREVGTQQSPYTLVSRFFRNHAAIQFRRAYHETVDDSVTAIIGQEPGWQVLTWPEVAVHHYGYSPDAIHQKSKFERAQAIMEGYLKHHPEDPYILNKLGALYIQQQDWATGSALLIRGLAHSDGDPITTYELHYHLGIVYRQQQQLEKAAHQYQIALQQPILEQLKVGAQLNYGSLLKAQGQLAEAIKAFEQAVAIDPSNVTAHYNLGVAHRARGYLEPAIAAYQQAIKLQPNYAEAYQNLGVALFKLGKLPESLNAFNQALGLYRTTDPEAASRLSQQLKQLGLPQW